MKSIESALLVFGLLALTLCFAGCGGAQKESGNTPKRGDDTSHQDPGDNAEGSDQGDSVDDGAQEVLTEAQPTGSLILVESWPSGTDLDHPEIPDAASHWVELIDAAERQVEFAEFYGSTAPSSSLEAVISAVQRAADRGVTVRFVFDKKFYDGQPDVPDRLGEIEGVEVRILDLGTVSDGVLHAKYFLVDREVLYLGSQNFDWRSLEHIQELGTEIRNQQLVDVFAAVFDHDWRLAGELQPSWDRGLSTDPQTLSYRPILSAGAQEPVTVYPALSPKELVPSDTWDLPMLLERIQGAQERIRVQLMSYAVQNYDKTEFRELDDALRDAAARGVTVELMVADWSKRKKSIGALKSLQEVENISVKLVTIPQSSTGFIPYARVIHAKYMTVDGEWSWLGTSNWSGDYFYKSRNVGVLVRGSAFAADLDAFFAGLWGSDYAEEVDPSADYEPPKISNLLGASWPSVAFLSGWSASDLAELNSTNRVVR